MLCQTHEYEWEYWWLLWLPLRLAALCLTSTSLKDKTTMAFLTRVWPTGKHHCQPPLTSRHHKLNPSSKKGVTDGPTDGPTDRRTDRPSYRVVAHD